MADVDWLWVVGSARVVAVARSSTLGSQRLLQRAVNRRPGLLDQALRKAGALQPRETVQWKSPLESDAFVEYRDQAALRALGVEERLSTPLQRFWPTRGPVWDALGVTNRSMPLLVEAKAHIPEAASAGTAASPASRLLIEQSLESVRRHLAPRSRADWSGLFYQYANRLAYQYFLRVLNGIESRLVFLYFTNAADMNGPTMDAEWRGATRMIHAALGLPPNLEHFGVFHAYIDARRLVGDQHR